MLHEKNVNDTKVIKLSGEIVTSVTSVLLILSSLSSGLFSPIAFFMIHQMEILRTSVLIGETHNEYIEEIVSYSMDIFNLLFIPNKYVPEVSGKLFLKRISTDGEPWWSGYKEGVAFYFLLIVTIAFLLYLFILLIIVSLFNILKTVCKMKMFENT